MDLHVNLKVNFRGNTETFLVTDSERTSWESVEAMLKTSFGLCNVQVKYFDEDNEEVSINSQEEYQEALKSAMKQGNQLQMNVYKVKGLASRGAVKKEAKEVKNGIRPLPLFPSMVNTVDRETQVTAPELDPAIIKEVKGTKEQDKTPAWFTSYMEQFKDQVVKETVEKLCREFSGQCCVHAPPQAPGPGPVAAQTQAAEFGSALLQAAAPAPAPAPAPICSSCLGPASGGGYRCSVCPSCTLCELCSFSHDPSHSLVRARTPLSIPEYGVAGEHSRFHRRGDRSFRKAEKQRLKAEKRLLKAEVKEIKKQLRMDRRGPQRNGTGDGSAHLALLQPRGAQANSPETPKVCCPSMVPTMTALFLDENLPDGTRLEPGTKFIKCWKMRNTGTVCWTTETKLKFMWGNLALASSEKQKEVAVPFLQPGQEGVVSVAFLAPVLEGTYTSHWRLAHRGEQFGPRVWCSIVVDPAADGGPPPPPNTLQEKEDTCCSSSRSHAAPPPTDCQRELFIPSVDLLTAQDLLSFELLDINIVQELERVPHNTPVDMTPCMSPLPHDGPPQEKPGLGLIKEEAEASMVQSILGGVRAGQAEAPGIPAQEEGEEDISGTQFVCETVIRSLTLEEAPDRKPLRRPRPGGNKAGFTAAQDPPLERAGTEQGGARRGPAVEGGDRNPEDPPEVTAPALAPSKDIQEEPAIPEECAESDIENTAEDPVSPCEEEEEEEEEDGEHDEVRSQGSSASSEDYIIILPDCFDTSRPLGESMYSSAMSQPGNEGGAETDAEADLEAEPELLGGAAPTGEREERVAPALAAPEPSSVNDMLCASQTLDAVPLTPEVVPVHSPPSQPPPASAHVVRSEAPCAMEMAAEALSINDPAGPEQTANGFSPVQSRGPARPSETCDSRPRTSQDLRWDVRHRGPRGSSQHKRTHGGITGGLVKGALSVAASAYKALFTGQPGPTQPPVDAASQEATMMAVLLEMGFGNRQLNQRLLRKHGYNLLDVVNELVQMNDNEWYATRY
ncbi:next to BRCA1 gene 1 protein-like isoform X1 [Anguilla anguilla]|uniref:next to BRCA1 gene 1 protein-like isoform X1 n=2 Tax=Anguilla anguilla TaxID=7936 RepID=UPI0015A93FFC|nr:next to BRCA1 gene 1 protein-like isoform X1 [Anguilla anguilla]